MLGDTGVDPRAVSYPFGAAGSRETAFAKAEGYETGFALAGRWRGDPMAITRLPVYPWALPRPGVGVLAPMERVGAVGANRCAVGTSIWKAWRESRAVPRTVGVEALAGD